MFHNTIELPKSYYDSPSEYKSNKISNWKDRGVIYEDFDDLYEVYMNTMKCQNCDKTFETSYDRCLDHDHDSGLFRMILCRGCNNHDSHLKYPVGMTTEEIRKEYMTKYREQNKDKITEANKLYYQENKEKINKYAKDNEEHLKEYRKQHYQDNKVSIAEQRKEHYEANRSKILEQKKKYNELNKESLAEKKKAYNQANKEKLNVKVKCFFCKTEMCRRSLNRHYNDGRCKKIKKNNLNK
tara:strand:- start:21 stop:740 length:720 start_codon:yes stop_codon:yes gene_type:complete